MRASRTGSKLSFLVWCGAFLFACNSVVGIDDLHQGPRPGSGGDDNGGSYSGGKSTVSSGGAPSEGGSLARGGSASMGGKPAGGSGSTIATGGRLVSPSGGVGAAGAGGLLNDAGLPGIGGEAGEGGGAGETGGGPTAGTGGSNARGGSGGQGGTTATGGSATGGTAGAGGASSTVNGKVIDAWGHPVVNAVIVIGSTTLQSKSDGSFSIQDVPSPYTVQVSVNPATPGGSAHYCWVYEGLTRRDPTLQVYRGVAQQSADAHVTISNGLFGAPPYTKLAFGSNDGSTSFEQTTEETTHLSGITWYGPPETQGRLHALRWMTDTKDLPTAYQAYFEQLLAVNNTSAAEIPLTFPSTAVSSKSVLGDVTSPTKADRRNAVFVRFASNAAISLVDDWDGPDTFSYLVPSLSNSVITVAASEGDDAWGGSYAIAHKDAVAGSTDRVSLSIPAPTTLLGPSTSATNVGTTTQFQWVGDSDVFVFHAGEANQGIYIVTSRKQVTIPNFAGSFPLRSGGAQQTWNVEVHDGWRSVDEATGPSGFQDSFGARSTEPIGALRGAGTYSVSETWGFKTQ